ncbi:MAG: tetratricopeptide repeat protein [Sedimentisphaerales bacterium]|jgi:TolA-binding protein
MAKKIIIISSFPICIALILVAVFLGATGHGQPASSGFEPTKEDIISLIESGEYATAESATDKLLSDFSGNQGLPEALYWIAERYERYDKFDKANRLYQQVIQNYSDSLWADKSKLAISRAKAKSLIVSQNYDQAQKEIDKLAVDFAGNSDLPEAIFWITERFQRLDRFEDAKVYYQRIIRDFPGNPWAEKAKFWLERVNILSQIVSQNYDGAKVALDKVIADFAGNPDLPESLFWISERLQRLDRFEDAKQNFQRIIDNYPASPWAAKSKFWFARINVLSLIISQDYSGAKSALDKFAADFAGDSDYAESLYWIAERYKSSKRYNDANTVYHQIIQQYLDSQWARKAEFGISKTEVLSLIDSTKYNEAKSAADKLADGYAGNPDLPEALYWIAGEFKWSKRFEDANAVYQQITEKYPENPWAEKAKLGVVRTEIFSLINSQDYKGAEAAVDKMVVDFEGRPDLPETLYWIADRYRWSNNHFEEANDIYQHIIKNYPGSSYANKAKLGISTMGVLSLIVAQDYNKVQKALDKLIIDFNGNPLLPEAVFQIGNEYYDEGFNARNDPNEILQQQAKDRLKQAADVFERIITELPESVPYTADAYYLSGNCCHLRGNDNNDYNKAIDYYEKAIAKWPDSQHACSAMGLIGVCYERLQKSGALTEEQAYPLTEQAYKAVIEKYPDNPYAEYACTRLGWMNFNKGRWADAAHYSELFLQKCRQDDPRINETLYHLGVAYENMGNSEAALKTYRLFLDKADSTTPGACKAGPLPASTIEDVKARIVKLESTSK